VGLLEAAELIRVGRAVSPVVLLTLAGAGVVTWLCLPAQRTRRGDAVVKQLQVSTPEKDHTRRATTESARPATGVKTLRA
jgi:hypothetical protein